MVGGQTAPSIASRDLVHADTDQRVAAAQMVVEERQRRAQREAVEPEADLGQLHGHGVEIDAVDAALEHVALEQVDVGQLARIDGDALLVQLSRIVSRVSRELRRPPGSTGSR